MGTCLSCLGISSDAASDRQERTPLVNDHYASHYGTSYDPGEATDALPEPEEQRLESLHYQQRVAHIPSKMVDARNLAQHVEQTVSQDHTLLFREVFSDQDYDEDTNEESAPEDEYAWLQRIISADPTDRKWDCNTIQKNDKPLTFSFDTFARE